MRLAPALILCLALAATALAQPAGVSRILRSVDFEERQKNNPEDLPMRWSKVDGPLIPHYVNGRLDKAQHRSGSYSFLFDLNGGSLVYRYDPHQIKVQSGAHYRVEVFVKTTALTYARARLTAYFTNVDDRLVADSVKHSPLYAAKADGDDWQPISVELSAETPEAHWLVIELELLQPGAYGSTTLGKQALWPQDIHGSAWFDDLTVAQVPKVKMRTDRPANIFRRGEPVALQVLVNDRFTDDLSAQLVIHDAAGKVVYQRSGALDISAAEKTGPLEKRTKLLLPELPAGWYEAALVITSQGQFIGRQTIDLVLLADSAPFATPDDRFGLTATDLPFDGWPELPAVLPYLGAGRIKLAVWGPAGDIQDVNSTGFDQLLVKLQELRITPTACLLEPPPQVSSRWPNPSWTQILTVPKEDWQPRLAQLVSRHATHLERWQLGDDGSDAFVTDPKMRQVYARLYTEFAQLMQKPDLAMPWPAWYEMEGQLPATVALSVPPSVLPSQLPLYMQDIARHQGHNLSLSLQLLDRGQYGREMQIRDLAQRVIYALAADARRIDIPLPFTVARDGDEMVKRPQELLMIVRTLITTLGGATFRGKVPMGDGVEAFLFDKNGHGILAIWDRGSRGGVKQLALHLGERSVRLDLWGNATPLMAPDGDQQNGQVQLTIGPTPIFLVDIDGELAQFRAGVAIDRPLIESSFQAHTRHIRFSNPYRQAISGSLKLKAPAGWTLSPPTFTFTLNPGETFDKEVAIEFPYNSFAGPKTIEAQFVIQAERTSAINVPITLNLGLSDVGMQTIALRDGKDIIVQQIITNYGERPINYSAFAMFPGQARQERLVTGLDPGRSTVKRYRFTAAAIAPGCRVRAGVKELTGTRVLNDEVEVQ